MNVFPSTIRDIFHPWDSSAFSFASFHNLVLSFSRFSAAVLSLRVFLLDSVFIFMYLALAYCSLMLLLFSLGLDSASYLTWSVHHVSFDVFHSSKEF